MFFTFSKKLRLLQFLAARVVLSHCFAQAPSFTTLPSQVINPDDSISVTVYGSQELTRVYRVNSDGSLRLPLLKNPIIVTGMRPAAVESAIVAALEADGLFVSPSVTVTLADVASRPISVVGAVRTPITFQMVGRVTLLDALARAGGVTPDSGPDIVLVRPNPESSNTLLERIPLRPLLDGLVPEKNFPLKGGEEIRVPEAEKIFVTGNVQKPGPFQIRDKEPVTVLRALALAGGTLNFSLRYAYVYRKEDKTGNRSEIQVPLRDILKRKATDFVLQPEDTLYVPLDDKKKNTMAVVDKVTGFGIATATGLIVWRGR
jgi:polysaccharide biosynthesis/export protein